MSAWPALPVAEWAPTRDSLQLWTQVVGKVRLARTDVMSHWWNVPLYVTARGLTTSLVPADERGFQIDFDLVEHRLDVVVTDGSRRSIRLAPMPVGPHVMHEAYSHEVSSAGYWPGPDGEGVFYSYAYPELDGFRDADPGVADARYDEALGEFVLPYGAVRSAADPDTVLLRFLQATYEAAADLAGWDRAALERS